MAVIKCTECGGAVSTAATACPHCGHPMVSATVPAPSNTARTSPAVATIKRKSSFAGGGCALQGLGLISLVLAVATFFTVVGPFLFGGLGLWLLIYGSNKSAWFECSACGGEVSNTRVKVCPHCNASFK
jgi:DNA-directed RNA polymerase subunit RPC12/RpoP